MRFIRRLSSLKITVKFSLAFGLLLTIMLLETIIGYRALTVVLESNKAILANTEMQRLAMSMSRNWESVKTLRRSFFFQSPYIGVDQAYDIYALTAGGKITEVIRDGATLKRQITAQETNSDLRALEPDLKDYLSTVSQYATIFEEATALETQLLARNAGLQFQLDQKATALLGVLQTMDQPAVMYSAYYEMRFHEKENPNSLQRISIADVSEAASRLRQSIENSNITEDDRQSALAYLSDYETIAGEMDLTVASIQAKRDTLNALDQSIEPILVKLMGAVDTQVGLARLEIETTRQAALLMLVGSMLFGLLSAVVIAVSLHYQVTRNIVNLTRVTDQFHAGNLDARIQIHSSDELGELGATFNEMAASVQRLNAELREQAIRDSLTGLYNRRYLDETLPRELARAERDGTPITLVMIDLDNFKEINDTHGHAVGDQLLRQIGHLLQVQSRTGDIACRFGGDEFIILLVDATLNQGVERAEAWLQAFTEYKLTFNGETIRGTLSTGVVEWIPGESSEDLFERVDAALYTAKNSGRNKVATQRERDSV